MSIEPIPLIVRREIPSPRARIFEAFTRPNYLLQWFTPSPEIAIEILKFEFIPGGRFQLRWAMPDGRCPVVGGVFESIDRPKEITMSWMWEAPDPLENIPMKVTFQFSEKRTTTEVMVTHVGIPSDMACTVHANGWEGTLSNLGRLFEMEDHR